MDLTYTPEQEAFRKEARAWLEANVPAEPLASFDTPEGFEAHEHGALSGTIRSMVYTGSVVEAGVEIPTVQGGERSLTVHLPTHRSFQLGDPIRLNLVSEYASIVRNACEVLGFKSPAVPIDDDPLAVS